MKKDVVLQKKKNKNLGTYFRRGNKCELKTQPNVYDGSPPSENPDLLLGQLPCKVFHFAAHVSVIWLVYFFYC